MGDLGRVVREVSCGPARESGVQCAWRRTTTVATTATATGARQTQTRMPAYKLAQTGTQTRIQGLHDDDDDDDIVNVERQWSI